MFLVVQLVVLFSNHLFHQINLLDAFTASCNASVLTMMNVTKCPSTLSSYKEDAVKKNCSSWASETQGCHSFEYHCVLSDDFQYAIEVCAPSILIIGGVCTMFYTKLQSIMRIDNTICEACPYSYNSIYAFLYSECYANITDVVTTTPIQRNISDEIDHSGALAALGTIVGIMSIVIFILIYFQWWKKVQDKKPRRSINRGPMIATEEEEEEILTINGNTHTNRSEGISFIRLSDDLARHFPHTKLTHLKYILRASGRVRDIECLDAANSVLAVFSILQRENIFRKKDVIFLQFLFRLTDCKDLNDKCINYALSMKALCFFEATSEQGGVNVQFHINGNFDNYTRKDIDEIVEEVADILECEKGNILVNGVLHSTSFLLVLSIKETYVWKLSCMNEQDQMKLKRLRIDYLIIGEEIIVLEGSKGIGTEKGKNELDAGIEFAKLCNYIARQFPQEKLQNLKDVIRGYWKLCDSTSLKDAKSALECFSIVQEKQLFTMTDVRSLQILCKKTNCQELFMKCLEFAKEHGSLYYSENLPESGFAEVSLQASGCHTNYEEIEEYEIRKIQYIIAVILNCSPDDILISHPDIGDEVSYMVDDSTSLHASDTIPEEVHCEHKVGPKISYGKTESDDILISHPDIGDEATYMVDDSTSLHASDTIPEEVHCEHKVGPKISYGKTESDSNPFGERSLHYMHFLNPKKAVVCVIPPYEIEETFSSDKPSTFHYSNAIPSEEQTALSPNDQPNTSKCTKDAETDKLSTSQKLDSTPFRGSSPRYYMKHKKLEETVMMEEAFSPDGPSTYRDCDFIPSEEQTAVSPNDQPISSTCAKDAETGGKSKDVEIDEEGDASKHSETAFKVMEYGKDTFLVNEKCSFIVSVKKKYGYRLHDMNKHDLEKLYSCNIRSIQIE